MAESIHTLASPAHLRFGSTRCNLINFPRKTRFIIIVINIRVFCPCDMSQRRRLPPPPPPPPPPLFPLPPWTPLPPSPLRRSLGEGDNHPRVSATCRYRVGKMREGREIEREREREREREWGGGLMGGKERLIDR